MKYKKYLVSDDIINHTHPTIKALAKELAKDCADDEQVAKNCFLYVRDEIRHSGDSRDNFTTVNASSVLAKKSGWCYAKAILLAALLRANNIPAGLCYQHLTGDEYKDGIHCLHGMTSLYLEKYGWFKVDPRGNKEGVDAQFIPPVEKLAFELKENEFNLAGNFNKPFGVVLEALKTRKTYNDMSHNLPDVKEFICEITLKDAKALNAISNPLLKFIFSAEVPEWFKELFTIKEFEDRISNSEYKHYGYVIDNKLVGYIAIKDDKHIYNLFVDKKYHKTGVAKKLWKFVKSNIRFDEITTNSPFCAIAVYKKFGFKISDDVKAQDELKYQPMVFKR